MTDFKGVHVLTEQKEARIQELTEAALALLKEGKKEEEVEKEIKKIALLRWAPSYTTLGVYIQAAMARALEQFAEAGRKAEGEEE
jgi:hypothetical protein